MNLSQLTPIGKCRYGKDLPTGSAPCSFCGATPDQNCNGAYADACRHLAAQVATVDQRRLFPWQ